MPATTQEKTAEQKQKEKEERERTAKQWQWAHDGGNPDADPHTD